MMSRYYIYFFLFQPLINRPSEKPHLCFAISCTSSCLPALLMKNISVSQHLDILQLLHLRSKCAFKHFLRTWVELEFSEGSSHKPFRTFWIYSELIFKLAWETHNYLRLVRSSMRHNDRFVPPPKNIFSNQFRY